MLLNILLAAGRFHGILSNQLEGVVNAAALDITQIVQFVRQTHPIADVILVTDDGAGKDMRTVMQAFSDISGCNEIQSMKCQTVFITSDLRFMNSAFAQTVKTEYIPCSRISFEEYRQCVKKYYVPKEPEEKKTSHWWNKKITPSAADVGTENSSVSKSISRVIAVTGHRGAGLTSTAANLAQQAHKSGLSAIVIDLDTVTRGMNMYYGSHTETEDEEKRSSLIRLLARPQNYETSAFSIKPGLYMSTLPYDFEDKMLIEQFVTSEKIISMLSVLKNKFNVCIIDMPLEAASAFKEVLIHIDYFALCVNNSLYSIFNTVRTLDNYLSSEFSRLLVSKAKVVVTRYNDKAVNQGENFSPSRVLKVLQTVSGLFDMTGEPAGYIPDYPEFDMQVETEILVCETNEKMHEAYKKVLIKILEGAE